MKKIILYQISCLLFLLFIWYIKLRGLLPEWLSSNDLPFQCALMGALGGIIYCLRGVYLNCGVRGRWDDNWNVWYYIRPIVSLLVGIVAYVFLKAGLLVLDAGTEESPYGFLALSFIAGLNVDHFLIKLEELAQVSWGIKPSRASKNSSNATKEK